MDTENAIKKTQEGGPLDMPNYFNPGNESFTKDSGSKIYIDKTELLEELNSVLGTSACCISLSHARRFGKSQAAGMIDAYYSVGCDSVELFSKFKISAKPDFKTHLNKYNVMHVDVSSIGDFHKEDLIEEIILRFCEEAHKYIPESADKSKDISMIINRIYEHTGRPFVIVIDEWDYVIRNHSDRKDLVHKYLQFLHSLFKSEESKKYLALGFITGILPVKKIQDESALNNFNEFTMLDSFRLTPYFGFTEDDVESLCRLYHMDLNSVKAWYDGYVINGIHMYNPNSVCLAMMNNKLSSYWKNTSSFESINSIINKGFYGLKEDILRLMNGERVLVNTNTFKNDIEEINSKDDAITALIHLGYLGYDENFKEAYMPNFEVSMAYEAALSTSGWEEISRTISRCDELLNATIRKNETRVAELIELAHETYTSILAYNDENSLSCAITMAYFTAPAYYNIIRELPSGKGFADFAFIPRSDTSSKPPMIIELKYDKDADSAIRQIKEKKYAGVFAGYHGEILLVGINYDKAKKNYECIIESLDKRRDG